MKGLRKHIFTMRHSYVDHSRILSCNWTGPNFLWINKQRDDEVIQHSDLLLLIFAELSAIGAIFEILNFLLK
jgi:hypothetical protein